jgi:hypothetical protein
MIESEWLLFLAQLPANPSSLRVNVWRRLREAGSTSLQNGVWILPRSPENTVFMERLLAYVRQNGAGGQIFLVHGLDQAVDEDILGRFKADRSQEYAEFLEQCETFINEIKKETAHQKFTFAELEENEQNLKRLRNWLVKIQKRDFFAAQVSQQAAAAFQDCLHNLQEYTRRVYTREGIEMPPDEDFPSKDTSLLDQESDDDSR